LYVMGSMAGSIKTELLMRTRNTKASSSADPDIQDLKDKRVVVASETEEGDRFAASKIKWLTGGDQLNARGLYQKDTIRFSPTHSIILMTNDKPAVAGDDYAFWKRVHLIPFKLSYVTKDPEELESFERIADPELDEKLKEEASGILAWLVRGCLAYQKEGLNPPVDVIKATLEYQEDQDILGQFIKECCKKGHGFRAQSSLLHEIYTLWYRVRINKEEKGLLGTKSFSQKMTKHHDRKTELGLSVFQGIEIIEGKMDALKKELEEL
jgi:putative DNA primase/helicase